MARRSYPTSEVRGGSWEELPHAPTPEARGGGWEKLPHTRGQGPQPRRPSWGISVPSQLRAQPHPLLLPPRDGGLWTPLPPSLTDPGNLGRPPTFPQKRRPQPAGRDPLGTLPGRDEDPRRGIPLPNPHQLSSEILPGDPYLASDLPTTIPSRRLPPPGRDQVSATLSPTRRSRPPPLGPGSGPRTRTPAPGHGARRPRTPLPTRGCCPRPPRPRPRRPGASSSPPGDALSPAPNPRSGPWSPGRAPRPRRCGTSADDCQAGQGGGGEKPEPGPGRRGGHRGSGGAKGEGKGEAGPGRARPGGRGGRGRGTPPAAAPARGAAGAGGGGWGGATRRPELLQTRGGGGADGQEGRPIRAGRGPGRRG